jgi:hypothetical protein
VQQVTYVYCAKTPLCEHCPMAPESPRSPHHTQLEAFQVVFVMLGLVVLPAALTLQTVQHPGRLQVTSANPTPWGYTLSLLLFLVPAGALLWWLCRRHDLGLQRRACVRTLVVLVPLGFLLDLLFGNVFFTFPNTAATVGLRLPAVGGPLPLEEFLFYLSGFVVVLLTYVWADEYWMAAYNIPDYAATARIPRLVRFHWPSLALGAGLLATAIFYKKVWSPVPAGFPWYFAYLVVASIVPSAGFFRTAQPCINWRAFSFTCFFVLLLSLLWEVTLAIPYGWWGYHETAMMGLTIGAWAYLPIEAVCVWLAVSFTTVIGYEVVKMWLAMGTRALEAFFGMQRP